MKGPQCQAENADRSKFCAECGSRLTVGGEVLFTKTMTRETGYKMLGGEQLTKEMVTIATVAYMSPEQAQGEDLDRRTDLWSFGVVLYEMLTGQLPFRGDGESIILHLIVKAEPKPPRQVKPEIPLELQKVIDRALKKNREGRYGSAGEIAVDLRKYLDILRAKEAGFFNLKSLARRMKKPACFIPAAALFLALAAI